jgi:hypothetical protein
MQRSIGLPSFFSSSWYTSFIGTTCCSKAGGGQLNWTMSCPFPAATSALARALICASPMLSTITSVSFFAPHSFVYFLLNQSS